MNLEYDTSNLEQLDPSGSEDAAAFEATLEGSPPDANMVDATQLPGADENLVAGSQNYGGVDHMRSDTAGQIERPSVHEDPAENPQELS